MTFRRRQTSLAALATVLAIGGAGGQPAHPSATTPTTEPPVLDLYGPGYLTPPYRTVRLEATDVSGNTVTVAYDAHDDVGIIKMSVGNVEVRFARDQTLISTAGSNGWVSDIEGKARGSVNTIGRVAIETLDEMLPPEALPFVTVLDDRQETLSGVEHRYLNIALDRDAFREASPERFWRWRLTTLFPSSAQAELWVASDGVVERLTSDRITWRIVERSMATLTVSMPTSSSNVLPGMWGG